MSFSADGTVCAKAAHSPTVPFQAQEREGDSEASWCVLSACGLAGRTLPRGSVTADESFPSCTATLSPEDCPSCPRAAGQRREGKAPSHT